MSSKPAARRIVDLQPCQTLGGRSSNEWSKLSRYASSTRNPMKGLMSVDPSIIQVNGTWYSFATRTIGSSVHIQIARSRDFHTWALVYNQDGSQRDALPILPSWVNSASPNTWAPDVSQLVSSRSAAHFESLAHARIQGRWHLHHVFQRINHYAEQQALHRRCDLIQNSGTVHASAVSLVLSAVPRWRNRCCRLQRQWPTLRCV